MVKIGSHVALRQAGLQRFAYKMNLPWIVKQELKQNLKIPTNVYSFSCERDLPEQIASIRSFIRYVGIPTRFIVVSDGTYSVSSKQLLLQVHECVSVCNWQELLLPNLPSYVDKFASIHPLGKKFAILVSIPIDETVIYTDSDILFFPAAQEILNIVQDRSKNSYYLLDCEPSLDTRLIRSDVEKYYPVNTGFMIFKKHIDWAIAFERLSEFDASPTHYTEQTLIHLTMHQNQAFPLCHSKFIVSISDLYIYQDLFAGDKIAIRHYVNTVRHKFWLSIFKSSWSA